MTHRFTAAARALLERHIALCLLCGHDFDRGDTAHLGYTAHGAAVVVGDCCSGKLQETAIRTYFLRRPFEVPPSHASLWRYMDFEKYVAMLATQTLFFCRLDGLQDEYEGAMASENTRDHWQKYYLNFFREGIKNPPPGYVCSLSSEEIESEAMRLFADFRQGNVQKTRSTFVTCWHERDAESAGMWRLYSQVPQYAVAVETTVGRLRSAVDAQIVIGRVRYIDYDKQYPDIAFPHFFKRVAFQDEREVRAVMIDISSPADCAGKSISADLNSLVVKMRVSPDAPDWFLMTVRNVTAQFDLRAEVVRSSLASKAFR